MRKQEATAAICWGQQALGLGGWTFTIQLDDDAPAWAIDDPPAGGACARPDLAFRECPVWVSPRQCEALGYEPYWALFHELVHVALVEAGLTNAQHTDYTEFTCNAISKTLADVYAVVSRRKKKARR